jgi:hypothetical protein
MGHAADIDVTQNVYGQRAGGRASGCGHPSCRNLTSAAQKYRERREKESVWIRPSRRPELPAFRSALCAEFCPMLPKAARSRKCLINSIPVNVRVEENAVGFRFSLALSAVSSFVRV